MKKTLLASCLIAVLFVSCQAEPESIREESKTLTGRFLKDLRTIQSRSDALKIDKKLKKYYRRFAALMIEAKELELKVPESFYLQTSHEKSDDLRFELKRLYHIEGVGAVLEDCQKEALYDLYLSSIINST